MAKVIKSWQKGDQKCFRVRRVSGFVQIPLSQVPRRDALGSTPISRAGALVDRVLRFFASYEILIRRWTVTRYICLPECGEFVTCWAEFAEDLRIRHFTSPFKLA